MKLSVSWSSECHSIIAYIAGHLLDADESSYLQELMDWDSSSPLSIKAQLESVSMEADSSEWEDYKYYHYAHALPTFATPWDRKTMCGHSKTPSVCVVTGIAIWTARAASIKKSREERQFAIMMIIHLMGDIHQPLHIGLWRDLGGLKIENVWKSYNPYQEFKHYNLHELWDRGLFRHYEVDKIKSGLIATPAPQDFASFFTDSDDEDEPVIDPGWMYLANELIASLNSTMIDSYKIADRLRDSRNLSSSAKAMRLPKMIAAETIKNVRDLAYTNETGKFIQSGHPVSLAYMDSRVEALKVILTKAGVRLADLLKHIIKYSRESEKLIKDPVVGSPPTEIESFENSQTSEFDDSPQRVNDDDLTSEDR